MALDGETELMQRSRSSRSIALAAPVLLLALTAGCAHRAPGADAGSSPSSATNAASAAAPVVSPVVTLPTPATPAETPDLSAVDGLLNDIDTDLNADASAGPDEGTTP